MQDAQIPQLFSSSPTELKASGLQLSAEATLRWAIPELPQRGLQLAFGEGLRCKLIAQTKSPDARVRWRYLRLNTETAVEENWQVIAPSLEEADCFLLDLEGSQIGRFLLDIQYSPGGDRWFLLREPALSLHIYPPQIRGLRLYTLLPNTLGPLTAWSQALREIREMDFTMVHVLPLTLQGHSQSPYAARDLFRLDPTLGQNEMSLTQEWSQFLETLRQLDLGLCVDLVVNHVAIDSELVRRRPEWIQLDPTETDGFRRAGFQGPDGWQSWRDLALLNYLHPDLRVRQELWDYMESYALAWADFAADRKGMVRLDNLHSTPLPFIRRLTRSLRTHYPGLAILGEYFGSPESCRTLLSLCDVDLLLATPWEHHFAHELRRYLIYLHQTQTRFSWFCPINSHDSGPPAQEFASVDATLPRYLLCMGLGTGASGMSQGVELGLLEKINFIGRDPLIRMAEKRDFRPFVRILHQLMAQHKAFQQGSEVTFIDRNHDAVIAGLRFHPEDPLQELYLLIANLDIYSAHTLAIAHDSLPTDERTVYDVLHQVEYSLTIFDHPLFLEASAIRIFRITKSIHKSV